MYKIIFILFVFSSFGQQVENFKYFSVGYDSIGTHWVSYRLTKQMVEKDTSQKRLTRFKSFNGVTHDDYTNTMQDRGHLMPADHLSFDVEGYRETYSLANIVPQTPKLNRRVWKELEIYEKRLAERYGCLFIIIRVFYSDKKIGKLQIPDSFLRVISQCSGEIISQHKFENL